MLLLLCGLHNVLQLKVVSGTLLYSNNGWDHSVWLSGGKVLMFLVISYHSASALGTFQLRLRQFYSVLVNPFDGSVCSISPSQ